MIRNVLLILADVCVLWAVWSFMIWPFLEHFFRDIHTRRRNR